MTQFFTILRKLGFSRAHLEADAKELSDGQKKKALLALSLCESAHLYLWDEPLNYIDALSRVQIEDLILRCQADASVRRTRHGLRPPRGHAHSGASGVGRTE